MKNTVRVDRALALLGAEARVRQLRTEMANIYAEFPELKSASLGAPGKDRRKRALPSNFKRAVSAGMRKYWARRKAAQKAQRTGKSLS